MAALLVLAWAPAAQAVPISYSFEAKGADSFLNGIVYRGETVTITLAGDTDTGFFTTPGQLGAIDTGGIWLSAGTTTVSVGGVIDTLTSHPEEFPVVTQTTFAFVPSIGDDGDVPDEIVGKPIAIIFGHDEIGLIAGHTPLFDVWDGRTALGPLALPLSGVTTFSEDMESFNTTATGGLLGWFAWLSQPTEVIFTVRGGLPTQVPEPSSIALLSIGLLALARPRRR